MPKAGLKSSLSLGQFPERAPPGTAPKFRAAVGRNAAFMRQGSGLTPDCRINATFRGQCPEAPEASDPLYYMQGNAGRGLRRPSGTARMRCKTRRLPKGYPRATQGLLTGAVPEQPRSNAGASGSIHASSPGMTRAWGPCSIVRSTRDRKTRRAESGPQNLCSSVSICGSLLPGYGSSRLFFR
jgi:hypothetical protein